MMQSKVFKYEDWMKGDAINLHRENADFPCPNLDNPLYISKSVVANETGLVAIGLVRITAEGIVIVKSDLPVVTRVNILNSLIYNMANDIQSKGLDECHVFAGNDKIYSFLKKKGFIPCKGTPLVLQFGGNNG